MKRIKLQLLSFVLPYCSTIGSEECVWYRNPLLLCSLNAYAMYTTPRYDVYTLIAYPNDRHPPIHNHTPMRPPISHNAALNHLSILTPQPRHTSPSPSPSPSASPSPASTPPPSATPIAP